jgi:hypothetical protein
VAGSIVTVWIDASGRLTRPPLTRAAVVDHVIGAAILTPASLALPLCVAGWAVSLLLDRRRRTRWEEDWLAVEPQWTRRRQPKAPGADILITGPDSNRILAVTRGKQVALGDDTSARPSSGSG